MPAVVLAAASLSLSGCQDEDFGYTASEIKYQKEFAKAFGKIDPNQDWNYATRGAVTVTTGDACEVKIYAKKGDGYKIVGDYANVSGTQTLGFDVQEGITDILVTNGQYSAFTKVGESVSLMGTRTAHPSGTTVTVAPNYKDFDFSYVSAVTDLLIEDQDNRGKVTENFSYVSTGAFTIYPIYWNTSSVHTMGVYYKDASGDYVTIPFYDTRVGDELALKEYTPGTKCEDNIVPFVGAIGKEWPNPVITKVEGGKGYYDGHIVCNDLYYGVGMKCSANEHTISRITGDQHNGYHYWYTISTPIKEQCGYTNDAVGQKCTHGFEIVEKDGNMAYHLKTEEECTHDNSHTWAVGDHCCMDHEIAGFENGNKYYNGYVEWTGTVKPVVGATCANGHEIDYVDQYGNGYYNTTVSYNYKSTFAQNAAFSAGKTVGSKGITINLPVGTQFGFYLDVYEYETYNDDGMSFNSWGTFYQTVYSQAEVNEAYAGKTTMTGKTPNAGTGWTGKNKAGTYVFGSTFNRTVNGKETKYVCFEDWNLAGPDLQDLVFVIDSDTPPIVVDEDADKWVICAEDLGNTFDVDYNDVVVSVAHISGKEEATITPLAAGGTLASYIYFGSTCLGEIHELFGASNTTSGSYTPINVEGAVTDFASEIKVAVSETWSLASSSLYDVAYSSDELMGGFAVKVVPAGEESSESTATRAGQTIQNSWEKGTHNYPYVICVPEEWERADAKGRFRWSNETTPISPFAGYVTSKGSGYNTEGHTFSDWVANAANNDWFMYPDEDSTTGLQSVTVITPVQPGGGEGGNDGSDKEPETPITPEPPVQNDPLVLGLEAQETIYWNESHYYKITVSDNSYLVDGAVVEFVHNNGGYSDVCLSGTTTTWAQVGKPNANSGFGDGKFTLNATQAQTIAENGYFYAIVWDGDIESVKITKP